MKVMEIQDKELHRIVTTVIIYNDEGKFLITKRSPQKKRFPNKWTVPGGGLNTDDYVSTPESHPGQWYYSLTNTLRREVKEEVGLEIGKPEYLLDLTLIQGDTTPVLVLSYFAEYVSGEVKLDEDSVEFAWISINDISKHDLIDGVDHELKLVDEILRARQK